MCFKGDQHSRFLVAEVWLATTAYNSIPHHLLCKGHRGFFFVLLLCMCWCIMYMQDYIIILFFLNSHIASFILIYCFSNAKCTFMNSEITLNFTVRWFCHNNYAQCLWSLSCHFWQKVRYCTSCQKSPSLLYWAYHLFPIVSLGGH